MTIPRNLRVRIRVRDRVRVKVRVERLKYEEVDVVLGKRDTRPDSSSEGLGLGLGLELGLELELGIGNKFPVLTQVLLEDLHATTYLHATIHVLVTHLTRPIGRMLDIGSPTYTSHA